MKNVVQTNVNNNITDKNDYFLRDPNKGENEQSVGLVSDKNNQILPPINDSDHIVSANQTFRERVLSWRSFMVLLLHLSFVIHFMPSTMFPFAIVCMSGPIRPSINGTLQNNTKEYQPSNYTEFNFYDNETFPQEKLYEFDWDSDTRGLVISGNLFINFLVPPLCNIIRGYLGNKLTLTIFNIILALLCFVSPLAARTNVYFLLVVRILSGLCMTANIPVSGDTMAWWLPVQEKLTSATIIISGYIVSGVVSPVLSGFLCLSSMDNGWPLIFYFNGSTLVVWTIAWYLLSSRRPEDHPFISEKEKIYIVGHRVGMSHATKAVDRPPYKIIMTSRPVLAFFFSIVCHVWVMVVIATFVPAYLTSVLRFSLQEAGVVLSVAYVVRIPAVLFWSAVGNWLLRKKTMNTNKVRKICYGFGQTMAFVFSLGVSFLDERHKWVASALVVLFAISATFGSTFSNVVPLDMAPRYAGFIFSMGASLTNLFSITGPLFAAAVTKTGSFEEWRVVWIVIAIVNLSAGWMFVAFGNASLQPWAVTVKTDQAKEQSI